MCITLTCINCILPWLFHYNFQRIIRLGKCVSWSRVTGIQITSTKYPLSNTPAWINQNQSLLNIKLHIWAISEGLSWILGTENHFISYHQSPLAHCIELLQYTVLSPSLDVFSFTPTVRSKRGNRLVIIPMYCRGPGGLKQYHGVISHRDLHPPLYHWQSRGLLWYYFHIWGLFQARIYPGFVALFISMFILFIFFVGSVIAMCRL